MHSRPEHPPERSLHRARLLLGEVLLAQSEEEETCYAEPDGGEVDFYEVREYVCQGDRVQRERGCDVGRGAGSEEVREGLRDLGVIPEDGREGFDSFKEVRAELLYPRIRHDDFGFRLFVRRFVESVESEDLVLWFRQVLGACGEGGKL